MLLFEFFQALDQHELQSMVQQMGLKFENLEKKVESLEKENEILRDQVLFVKPIGEAWTFIVYVNHCYDSYHLGRG